MTITYHGVSCLKITTKTDAGKDVTLITDPFDAKKAGLKLSRLKADVVVSSRPEDPLHGMVDSVAPQNDDKLIMVTEPGEYEANGIAVQGLYDSDHESIVYRIELERVALGFLGSIAKPTAISDAQNEILQNADILIVPIGGKGVTDMKGAHSVVNQLQPRLVIPIYYALPGLKISGIAGDPEQFIKKELSIKADDASNKYKVTANNLPQDEMRGVLLNP